MYGRKLSVSNSNFYDEMKVWLVNNLEDLDMIIRKNQDHPDPTFKMELMGFETSWKPEK